MNDVLDVGFYGVSIESQYRAYQAIEMKRLENLMQRKFVHYCRTGISVNIFQAGISQYQVGKPLYYLNEYRGINQTYWAYPKSLYELFCYMQRIAPLSCWQQS